MSLEYRHVTIDGAQLAYLDVGPPQAEVCVLLHGYCGSALAWHGVLPDLARRYRVIAPDWFGWGRSEWRPGMDLRLEAELNRLEALLDSLGLRAVNLVGHDYGGLLTIALTLRNTQRVSRLAILNSRVHRSFRPHFTALFFLLTLLNRTGLGRACMTRLPLAALHRNLARDVVQRKILDEATINDYLAPFLTPHGRAYIAHFYRDYFPGRHFADARLREIRRPAAVLWGRHDPYLSPAIARSLAKEISGCALREFDCGHFVVEECAREVAGELLALLERPVVNCGGGADLFQRRDRSSK